MIGKGKNLVVNSEYMSSSEKVIPQVFCQGKFRINLIKLTDTIEGHVF